MGIRYLGSKRRVLDALVPLIGEPRAPDGRFVDAFAGTGAVASAAADLGWAVHINDHLRSATLMSRARMLSDSDVTYMALSSYKHAITYLNRVSPIKGFMWREYSPASVDHAPRPRQYFTERNAAHLDGIRYHIRRWREANTISREEEALLLADLIEAASSVANTAGTFGCFLSRWSPSALKPLRLRERALREKPVPFTASEADVFSVVTRPHDTVYLDPPYTKRQYAAYYHILETLAFGDEPIVSGVTGLRPWRDKASVFAYKRRAFSALLRLTKRIQATRILISYSDDGHINLTRLIEALRVDGTVEVHELGELSRYSSNGSRTPSVCEFVIDYRRAA